MGAYAQTIKAQGPVKSWQKQQIFAVVEISQDFQT
jgi:hypothetical protein